MSEREGAMQRKVDELMRAVAAGQAGALRRPQHKRQPILVRHGPFIIQRERRQREQQQRKLGQRKRGFVFYI